MTDGMRWELTRGIVLCAALTVVAGVATAILGESPAHVVVNAASGFGVGFLLSLIRVALQALSDAD
jgi:hypothetical protein